MILNTGIMRAGKVDCFGKSLEQNLYNVMRLLPVEQFEMKVAFGCVGKPLKELPCQAKAKSGRHVLILFFG